MAGVITIASKIVLLHCSGRFRNSERGVQRTREFLVATPTSGHVNVRNVSQSNSRPSQTSGDQ